MKNERIIILFSNRELEVEIDAVVFISKESLHICMGFCKLLYLVYWMFPMCKITIVESSKYI